MDYHYIDSYETSPIKVWARKVSDDKKIHADDATKADGPFYCPDTFDPLIVRKCDEKRDHFAYHGRQSPVYSPGETLLHKNCKLEICKHMKEKFPDGNWEHERIIPKNPRKKFIEARPDVSGRINKIPVVIEIQASSLKIDEIVARSENYKKHGCHVLWIIPLKEELGDDEFRPRLYERYLHEIYYGRVYYWVSGYGTKLKPVHFDPVFRDIEIREWYENGELVSVGGYQRKLRTIYKPNYGKTIDISADFKDLLRSSFYPENEKKAVPELMIYMDNLNHWWKKAITKSFLENDSE
jgi:hypothetical protein